MSRLEISDHALLRFIERAGGLEVAELRVALADSLARAHAAARSVSDADYLIRADGLLYVVRGETVTTILEAKDRVSSAATLAQRKI